MPTYLAKDFLAEYQQSNLCFLTTTLLTTPTHLDFTENYIQTSKKRLTKELDRLSAENHDEITKSDTDIIHLRKENSKDILLESYDSPTKEEANPKNIIQIDSDSDFGISSSYDSLVINAEDLESMNKLIHPPLCSEEIKRLTPECDWLLEEINDVTNETLPPIAVLNRRLNPVRVADPFKEIRRKYQDAFKLAPFIDPSNIDSNDKNKSFSLTFEKIENIEHSVNAMQLEENIMIDSDEGDARLKECIGLTLEKLELYEIEEKPDETEWIKKAGSQVPSSQLECIEDDYEKKDLMEGMEPISPEPRIDPNKLDSPETSFNSIDAPKLPDIIAEKEDLSDMDDLYIVSPKSKETLMKNIWNEEKTFGDILLMLLPEKNLIDHKSSSLPIRLPQINRKSYQLDEDDYDGLEWDSLLHQYSLIDATEKCLLDKVVPFCKNNCESSKDSFERIDLDIDQSEVVLDDWKREENKIKSLQYITSCKKIESNVIPMTKMSSEAPVGYHKPKIIERKECNAIKSNDRILNITPIPHVRREKERISPLDSYILLRKAKSQWKTSSGSEPDKFRGMAPSMHKVVSAAKVKPMIVHEAKPFTGNKENELVTHSVELQAASSSKAVESKPNPSSDLEAGKRKETFSALLYNSEQNCRQTAITSGSSTFQEVKQQAIKTTAERINFISKSDDKISTNEQLISDETDFSVERIHQNPKPTASLEEKKEKTFIPLKLCNKYEEFIKDLSDDLQTILHFLQRNGCISQNYTVTSLTCERTLFLLKQEETKFIAGTLSQDIFSGVLCLHTLTQVIETIVNCNILSACAILKSMTQKHEAILGNCLEPLHKKLLIFFCGSEENHVIHPKLKKIQYLLNSWLKIDPSCKIIILIRRMFEFVAPNLQNFLSAMKGVNIYLYPSQDASESVFLDVFYKANVILVHNQNDIQTCPWQYFQYAIEFEECINSWCELAFNSNPNLKQYLSFKPYSFDFSEPDSNEFRQDGNPGISGQNQRTIPILCTPSVAKEKELLLALENKLNIQLTVKDYSKLNFYIFPEFSFQPDLVINEQTGIILVYVVDFVDSDEMFDVMQKKIISVALKCSKVYILMYKESSKSNESLFGKMLSHIVPLVATLHSSLKHVKCKVVQTFSMKGLAKKIRFLCDKSLDESPSSWNEEFLNNKNWLEEEFSENEQFLLAFPFMNSFCAQSILRKFASIKNLLSLSRDQLISELPNIPQFVLDAFQRVNHTTHDPVINEPIDPAIIQPGNEFANNDLMNTNADLPNCSNNPFRANDFSEGNPYNVDVPRPNSIHNDVVSDFISYPNDSNQITSRFERFQNQTDEPVVLYNQAKELGNDLKYFPQDSVRVENSCDLNQDRMENAYINTASRKDYSDREVPSTSFDTIDLSNIPDTQPEVHPNKPTDRVVPVISSDQFNDEFYCNEDNNNLSLYQQDYVKSKISTHGNRFSKTIEEATSQDSVESFRLNLPKCIDGTYSMFPVEEQSRDGNDYVTNETTYPTERTEYATNETQYSTSETAHFSKRTGHPTSGSGYSENETKYPTNKTDYSTNETEYLTKRTGFPTNGTEYPTTNRAFPLTSAEYSSNKPEYTTNNYTADSTSLLASRNPPYAPNNSTHLSKSGMSRFYDNDQQDDILPRPIYQSNSTNSQNLPLQPKERRNQPVYQHQHDSSYRLQESYTPQNNYQQVNQNIERVSHSIPTAMSYSNLFQNNNQRVELGPSSANRRFVWDKNSSREIPRQAVKAFNVSENFNRSKSSAIISQGFVNEHQTLENTCFPPGWYQNNNTNFMSKIREGNYPNFNTSLLSPEQKKRKLTYKKVPGSKGGQTKLTFQ